MSNDFIRGKRLRLRPLPNFPTPQQIQFMWDLLALRTPEESISHALTGMPTWEQHCLFMNGRRYRSWNIITIEHEDTRRDDGDRSIWIGAIYLSHRNEIGISILPQYRRMGYGYTAVRALMRKWGHALQGSKRLPHKEFYANINPQNLASIAMFEKLGFNLRQVTMAKQAVLKKSPWPNDGKRMVMDKKPDTAKLEG